MPRNLVIGLQAITIDKQSISIKVETREGGKPNGGGRRNTSIPTLTTSTFKRLRVATLQLTLRKRRQQIPTQVQRAIVVCSGGCRNEDPQRCKPLNDLVEDILGNITGLEQMKSYLLTVRVSMKKERRQDKAGPRLLRISDKALTTFE